MNEEKFKEMFLLYEELVRKEVEHYCKCHPNTVNAYDTANSHHAPKKVENTFVVMYGRELALLFFSEMNARKKKTSGE